MEKLCNPIKDKYMSNDKDIEKVNKFTCLEIIIAS